MAKIIYVRARDNAVTLSFEGVPTPFRTENDGEIVASANTSDVNAIDISYAIDGALIVSAWQFDDFREVISFSGTTTASMGANRNAVVTRLNQIFSAGTGDLGSIKNISGINITSPQNGEVLVFNSTTKEFENETQRHTTTTALALDASNVLTLTQTNEKSQTSTVTVDLSTLATDLNTNIATTDLTVSSSRDLTLNSDLEFIIGQGGSFAVKTGQGAGRLYSDATTTRINGLAFPSSDGTSGQFISTNGSGTLSFQSLTSGNDNASVSVDNGDLKIEVQPRYIYETVKNVTAGTLTKGTPVKVTGAAGNTPEVIAADAATNYPAHFILLEDISADSTGGAISHGHINQVSVPDASIYSEGDALYLASSGGWALAKPTGTNQIQKLGVVLKVDTVSDTISGIVQGAGRTNDIPNIPNGQAWIGNSSGVATPTTLATVATSGAYSDLSGTPTIPTSGVDFDPVGTDNSTDVSINANANDVLRMNAGQILGAQDAAADKLVFWDDSAGKLTYATIGTNLTMTDTTLSASGGGGGAANMSQTFSAPTNPGEFQNGARLVVDAYGTNPAATAGTLSFFGNTAAAAVGAQSAAAAATGMLTVVTDAGDSDELLVEGVVKMSTATTTTLLPTTAKKGVPVYMSTTAGAVTTTAPSGTGEFVRVVGHVVDATNRTIYFKPDNTWLEL